MADVSVTKVFKQLNVAIESVDILYLETTTMSI